MLKIIQRLKLAMRPELIPADLTSLLLSLDPSFTYQERMSALGQLMDWIRLPVSSESPSEDIPQFVHSRDLRLKFLFNFMERHSVEARNFADTIQELIQPGSAIGLYCLTGLAENHGFFSELSNRLIKRVLPETFAEKDLSEIFGLLFKSEEDAIWIETSFKNIFALFQNFILHYSIGVEPLKRDLHEAKMILGAQVASLGTGRNIRKRLPSRKLSDSSFLKLNSLLNTHAAEDDILNMLAVCRHELSQIRENLETSGVSVDLIFKIERMGSILDRIQMLIHLGKEYGNTAPFILGPFVGRLIRNELKVHGVREYIQENVHLLTRKIVERAGEKGDHYIAGNSQEQKKLFYAAALAGVLTCFTALFKFMIGIPQFPIFFEGFFFFVNYALSFLIMQRWHLALSSKQPAYMASALSKTFENFKITKSFTEVSCEIRKIINSQLITTVGNLALVIPGCILFDWIWLKVTGHHIMTRSQSIDVIYKHHPFTSMSIFYAFLTGIFLWLSSVVAGWCENLIVFRELPEAIRTNAFLRKVLSKGQLNYMASHLAGTVGGIAGNLTIAFLLALPIVISKFTSIPLDIRHVTLAAGTIIFALNGIEWSDWSLIITMFFSIILIGMMNFGVSFYFAIRMAATARNLEDRYLKKIFKVALRKKSSPRDL